MMMDQCAMDDRVKILNLTNTTNAYSNIAYHNGHKNPFDRQFELALKSRISYPTSSNTTSQQIFNQSPLNTPLIPPDSAIGFPSAGPVSSILNTANGIGNDLTVLPVTNDNQSPPVITTAQITNLILETETQLVQNKNSQQNLQQQQQQQPDSTEKSITELAVTFSETEHVIPEGLTKTKAIDSNNLQIDTDLNSRNKNEENQENKKESQHRSNVVSVICPPVPCNFRDESKCRSAPVILEKAEVLNPSAVAPKKRRNIPLLTRITPQENKQIDSNPQNLIVSYPNAANSNNLVLNDLNKELQYSETGSTSQESSVDGFNYELNSTNVVKANVKRILPKQLQIVDSSSNHSSPSSSLTSSTETITQYSIVNTKASLPSSGKRKEKTLDELISKIKATEAALPPKAKPGRKSKSSKTEEDFKEKKRLSLERNRAAAMRCRLKKKKEIDELKHKVEAFERQNHDMKLIINSLHNEIAHLKNQLLRHKDCN